MPPAWLTVALLLLTFLGEFRTWRDFAARKAPSAQDRGSLRLNNAMGLVSLAAGLATAFALRGVAAVAVPPWLAWAGAAASVAGTALRAWAVEVLGRWFSLTIQVRPGQPVIDTGPFRLVRHPSYLGGEVALAGAGLAAGNWISPLAFWLPWLVAHVYRIRVEEDALRRTLGAPYEAYAARTWRLLPPLW
ncbi:MAG: isoprenylcysteine carboxylmethyltransferase family protein [Anaeromyxobacter sp.]